MRLRNLTVAVVVATLAVAMFGGPALAKTMVADVEGGRLLTADLLGANEVPGPGDPDGSGTAVVSVNPSALRLCYELTAEGIAPAKAAHIHEGPSGEAGPVVVTLAPLADGSSSGCMVEDETLLKDIKKNPAEFYVNVHNSEFTAGAIRGQLSR